eukprot:6186084-Pleurochrysis_carterae.AAC.1
MAGRIGASPRREGGCAFAPLPLTETSRRYDGEFGTREWRSIASGRARHASSHYRDGGLPRATRKAPPFVGTAGSNDPP